MRSALTARDEALLKARELLVAFANHPALAHRPTPPGVPEEFDEEIYLLLHPDVADAVRVGGFQSGYDHWKQVGQREGRICRLNRNRFEIPADFDDKAYLRAYPDVALQVEAGVFRSGYEHWKQRGIQEQRAPVPGKGSRGEEDTSEEDSGSDFDEQAYLVFNPDIAEAVQNGRFASGYQHWIKHGVAEHRVGGLVERVPDRREFLGELEHRPFGVNLFGFLSTRSGLGSVVRACEKGLVARQIPLNPIDIEPWSGSMASRSLPKYEPYRVNLIQQNADTLHRFLQTYGIHILNGCYNIGYWLWELPSARSDWHYVYQYVDEVWVASDFCKTAFQTLTKLPVIKVPMVVDGLESKVIYGREYFGFPQDVFVFCYVFDVSSYMERKNPFALIQAFREEFKDSKDVLLYLKISNSTHDQTRVAQLHAAAQKARNIRIYEAVFNEEQMASLHNCVDCLVSPHRSEGFGFNVAEAMYFGKPVIATRYSSNVDFMNDENGYLIDCKLIPIKQDIGPYLKGSLWADPSVDHMRALMRRVFENPEERERKGKAAALEMRQNYSSDAVGKIMEARFREIGIDRPRLPEGLLKSPALPRQRLFHAKTPSEIRAGVRAMKRRPLISVITPVYNVSAEYLRACIESVRGQWYPFWELCLCDDASTNPETLEVLQAYQGTDRRIKILYLEQNHHIAGASNRAVEISMGEYLAFLDNDDELTPDALYEVAQAINDNPGADLLYSDEDKIEADGSFSDHFFKPDWSPEHLQSNMYLLHLMVVGKQLFFDVGGFRDEYSGAQDYDLALRASTRSRGVQHIPKILYHWRKIPGSAAAEVDAKPAALDAARRALEDWVASNHVDAKVEPGKLTGHFRVRHAIHGNPRVTLCIPTNDNSAEVQGRGKINLLTNFVKSIAAKTTYSNYELLICDNGNLSARTKADLRDIPYKLISYRGSLRPFNFSSKANFMFKQLTHEDLVLLNDDLEVISGEWLEALLEYSQQQEIGAVGARLLFPGDRIQHAGIGIGINNGVAHLYHNFPASFVGYNGFTHIVRNYSAVTGACLATRKALLERTGGFDERLAIDYNDIDFCLKIREKGLRVVYTPYAELYHFEGQTSSRKEPRKEETDLFRTRWARYIENDPYYNVNLTRTGVDFALGRGLASRSPQGASISATLSRPRTRRRTLPPRVWSNVQC